MSDPPREEEEKETVADGPPFPRLHAVAVPLVVVALISLVVGAVLLTACTPTSSTNPCVGTNGTCLPSGNCPYAPDGVVVLSVALILLVLGIVGLWRHHPREEGPHPEPASARPPPDTAMTRMEREQRERRESRPGREP